MAVPGGGVVVGVRRRSVVAMMGSSACSICTCPFGSISTVPAGWVTVIPATVGSAAFGLSATGAPSPDSRNRGSGIAIDPRNAPGNSSLCPGSQACSVTPVMADGPSTGTTGCTGTTSTIAASGGGKSRASPVLACSSTSASTRASEAMPSAWNIDSTRCESSAELIRRLDTRLQSVRLTISSGCCSCVVPALPST